MTNKERAEAWMREQCASGDGPRMNGDAADDSKCDCHDALTALLDNVAEQAYDAGMQFERKLRTAPEATCHMPNVESLKKVVDKTEATLAEAGRRLTMSRVCTCPGCPYQGYGTCPHAVHYSVTVER